MAIIIDASGATLARKITVPSGGSSATTLENYVTVEEDPSDISTATRHPVDSGAIMSDHIILQPPELRMRIGWSNADQQANGDAAYVRNLYAKILQVKNNRQLCQVYTGKRYYTNMWPLEIRMVNNLRYTLDTTAACRSIIADAIVSSEQCFHKS